MVTIGGQARLSLAVSGRRDDTLSAADTPAIK